MPREELLILILDGVVDLGGLNLNAAAAAAVIVVVHVASNRYRPVFVCLHTQHEKKRGEVNRGF